MTERVHIICHGDSGGGKGFKKLNVVQKLLDNYQIDYLTYFTDYSAHAYVLTQGIIKRDYRSPNHKIMVIGGDGTLHEVVNAMHQHKLQIPITYIPAGTGNDFHRAWQANKSTREIVETMIFDRRPVLIPIFTYDELYTQRSGVILNSMGFGFDAEVNYAANKLPFSQTLKKMNLGNLTYLIGLFASFDKLSAYDVELLVDNKPIQLKNCSLICVMNQPYFGGGIELDPLVDPRKSELSLIAFQDINAKALASLLPKVLITKKQHASEHVSRYTGQQMEFKLSQAIRGQVDGEDLTEIEAHVRLAISDYPFYL